MAFSRPEGLKYFVSLKESMIYIILVDETYEAVITAYTETEAVNLHYDLKLAIEMLRKQP